MREALPNKYSRINVWIRSKYGFYSVEDWIERMATDMLSQSSKKKLPIQLDSLFNSRKILGHEIRCLGRNELKRKGWGELKVEKLGFIVVINRGKNQKFVARKCERFTIAHEIAHTFFYDLSKAPPQRILPYQGDNSDEELCNRLAAAILLPKEKIDKFIGRSFKSSKSDFRIGKFRQLLIRTATIFDVNLHVVARRLIEDLSLWDMLVLGCGWRFKERANKPIETGKEAWRLEWYAKPAWARERLFIPTTGFPKIHLKTVEDLYQLSARRNYLGSEEALSKFRLGNLRGFMSKTCGLREKCLTYAALIRQPDEDLTLFASDNQNERELDYHRRRQTKIIVCIPLPGHFKNSTSAKGLAHESG